MKRLLLSAGILFSVVLFYVFGGAKIGFAFTIFVVCNHWLDTIVNMDIVNAIIKLRDQ